MEQTVKTKTETDQNKEQEKKYAERIVRIMSEDIEGRMTVYSGLTKIKGVSWGFSNALCHALRIDKLRKIGSLTNDEVKKISDFIKNPKMPEHVLNRRKDFDTGENQHLTGSNLDLKKEFDIKRLKKIKSYRGIRHGANLPVRGQRTRSNFRKNRRKGAGIKKKGKKK